MIEVRGKLELDGSGWEATMRRAEKGVTNLGNEALGALKGQIAAAFAVGAVEEFIRRTVESVYKIKNLSEQFDLSTDQVQKYSRAAEHVGLQFEDVGRAIDKLGKTRKEAGEKEGEALHELEKYGLTLEDIRNPLLQNIDLIEKMRGKMEELARTAEGRQELQEFFGRGGARFGAVFDEADKQKDIVLISSDNIDRIDKAVKGFQDMKLILEAIASGPLGDIAKIFNAIGSPNNKLVKFLEKYAESDMLRLIASFIKDAPNYTVRNPDQYDPDKQSSPPTPIFQKKENQELWEQLHEAEQENRLAGLSQEQKITELKQEQLELAEKIKGETGDAQLTDQIKFVKNSTEIANLERNHKGLGLKTSDSLTRTGNFLGASSSNIVSIGERTNQLLTQIRDRLPNTKQGNTTGNLTGTTSVSSS